MFKTKTLYCLALVSFAAGCQMEVSETEHEPVGAVQEALTGCTSRSGDAGNVCDLGGGELEFRVTLPSGQQYVEVFARKNGVQDVATNIVSSGVDNGDGTTTYSLVRSGYAASDKVEYRFYSYLPASPGVFTPGPAEGVWYGYIGQVAVAKDAAAIYSSYGLGLVPNQNFGSASTVDIGEYHLTSEGFFAYSLANVPSGATVDLAELVVPYAYAPGGSSVRLDLGRITSSWAESTITWNNRPTSSYVETVTVASSGATRLAVTSSVAASLSSGEAGFVLKPSSEPSTDNVFIDAKEKSGGQPTYLKVHWVK